MRELAGVAVAVVAAGLWQGLVVVAVLSLVFRLAPRVSAAVRAAVWAGAFALLAAVPLLRFVLRAEGAGGSGAAAVAVPHGAAFHVQPAWGYGLLTLWAALVVVRGARLAIQVGRLRGLWRRAVPMEAEPVLAELLCLRGRRAELCRSEEVDAPVVIGFMAPRLLVPAGLADAMDADDLRQIALHEMEHLRRGDDWINLLQKLALVVLPLHPGLVWIDRRLSRERELACDAGVVARTASPIRYAACLMRLAEHRLRARVAALSLAAWSRRPELVRRVETLLRPVHGLSPVQSRVMLGLVLAGLGVGAIEMARAPRMVSLAEPAVSVSGTGDAVNAGLRGVAAGPSVQAGGAPVVASPVVYREGGTRPVMQNAVYVAGATKALAAMRDHSKARKLDARGDVGRGRGAVRMPRAMLVSAHGAEEMARAPQRNTSRERRPVYTLTIERVPAYAAVAFGDGWLLIQI